jgi:hypothetical protein
VDEPQFTDNWQSLGKAHQQDNMQGVDTDAFHDNRQKVTSTVVQSAAPQLPAHVDPVKKVQSSAPQSLVNATTGTHDKATVAGASQATEDDELRARMKKLKATVRDVSDTLSELAPKP